MEGEPKNESASRALTVTLSPFLRAGVDGEENDKHGQKIKLENTNETEVQTSRS